MKFAVLTKDVRLFEQVRECFEESGSSCDVFYDEVSIIRALKKEVYDLILLDADIEYPNGNPVFAWINCHSGHTAPVILMGHFKNLESMTEAFDSGADDIITRPINSKELHARSLSAIKRLDTRQDSAEQRVVDKYTLNKDSSSIFYGDESIRLSTKEFAIAWLFFCNPGMYFSRKQIATMIWGSEANIIDRTLEQHVYKLRKKLNLGKDNSVQLRTVYSLGYKLEIDDGSKPATRKPLVKRPEYFSVTADNGLIAKH